MKVELFDHRLVVIRPMWHRALSTDSQFCRAVVAAGLLSQQQMLRAARRYRLGGTRQGGVIFWQIDQEDRIHDGKVMYYRDDCHRDRARKPTWVSWMLQRRYQWPDRPKASHCLFGLHLLRPDEGVAVVEAEKTAVILSERRPQWRWMATGGLSEVQPEKFRPLRGHSVVLYPDTDPEGTAYRRWCEAARWVESQPWWEGCQPIVVSSFLETHASPAQKQRKIDLADFIAEV